MDKSTVYASGTLYWAKIVGDGALHDNYERTARQWATEFEPDDPSFLKDHGLLDRLKEKEDPKNPDKGRFLVLRKPELNRDGEKNDPIRIYDEDNQAWPNDQLIGNGTKADLKLSIIDWGKGKKKSIWVTAIRITDLVPYESNEFAGMDSGDDTETKPKSKPKTKTTKKDEELDDDIPF